MHTLQNGSVASARDGTNMSFGVVMQQRHFTINYSKERNLQKLPREMQHANQALSTECEYP